MSNLTVFFKHVWRSRNCHKQLWLLAAILSLWTTRSFAQPFTASPAAIAGPWVVNQASGIISFCRLEMDVNSSPAKPSGSCIRIGSISPSGGTSITISPLSTPITVPLPTPKTLVGAVFTNSVTGEVVGCAVTFPQNGAPAGSCAVIEPHGF